MNIDDIIENARLKGRVIALDAEVQTLQAEVRCLEAVIRSHERVDCLIVANLKAELQRLRASSFTTAVPSEDYEKLKAELAKSEEHNAALCERLQDLNSVVFTTSCTNAGLHSQFANSEQKVARLIKAGTAMDMALPDTDEANAAYRAFEYAAKEGKQS